MTGVQTCALPILRQQIHADLRRQLLEDDAVIEHRDAGTARVFRQPRRGQAQRRERLQNLQEGIFRQRVLCVMTLEERREFALHDAARGVAHCDLLGAEFEIHFRLLKLRKKSIEADVARFRNFRPARHFRPHVRGELLLEILHQQVNAQFRSRERD